MICQQKKRLVKIYKTKIVFIFLWLTKRRLAPLNLFSNFTRVISYCFQVNIICKLYDLRITKASFKEKCNNHSQLIKV